MSPLYSFGGKLLVRDGKLAADPSCCCNGCCCWNFTQGAKFTFTIDCGNGPQTFTGTLNNAGQGVDIETGAWTVSVLCTSIEQGVGFLISVVRFGCAASGQYICFTKVNNFVLSPCQTAPLPNFTVQLTNNNINVGSITFTPP